MRHHTIALLLPIVCLAAALSAAQSIAWKDINGSPGFIALQNGANGRIISEVNLGIYTSDDDGVSWSRTTVGDGIMNELVARGQWCAVSRYNQPLRRFDIVMSSDNGTTWSTVFRETRIREIFHQFLMLSDSGELYAIYDSLDFRIARFSGGTWHPLGQPIPTAYIFTMSQFNVYFPLLRTFMHHGTFYVGTQGDGVYISTDTGSTWNHYFEHRDVNSFAVTKDDQVIIGISQYTVRGEVFPRQGGIYLTPDDGKTMTPLGLDDRIITSILTDRNGRIGVVTTSDVQLYDAVLRRWSIVPLSVDNKTVGIVTPANALLCTSPGLGVFRSNDFGSTWSTNSTRGTDVFSVFSPVPGTVLAGTIGQHLFRSTSGGLGWITAPDGSTGEDVYALTSVAGTYFAGTEEGLYASSDGGTSWVNRTSADISGAVYALAADSGGRLFAGTNFGVFRSSDGGMTWHSSGLADQRVLYIAVDTVAAVGRVYAASTTGGVSISDSHGESWSAMGAVRDDIQCLVISTDGTVFLGVYGGMLSSSDGGATWSAGPQFTTSYVNTIAILDGSTYFAGTDEGVYRTLNGGGAWSAAGLQGSKVLSLAFDPEHSLIAGVWGSGVFQTAATITSVPAARNVLPFATELLRSYPNPFNPQTEIEFSVRQGRPVPVTLKAFDALGREVAGIMNETLPPGNYRIRWNAAGYPSGIYFIRLSAGSYSGVLKTLLLR